MAGADGGVDPRRRIPRTDAVLADERLVEAAESLGREAVKEAVQLAQRRAREGEIAPGEVADEAVRSLPGALTSLRPVLNATGVIVHTNLGRAPLSRAARTALELAAGTTDVEFDLADGSRARRGAGALTALAAAVPDAGDVHVVNNNAAALALCALALAPGKEIVVARGELVEIGDGFRIPELLAGCGARLVEVGATNRVHVRDYVEAIGPETAFVLKVHPSNFLISGFTSAPSVAELVEALDVPVIADIGSGLLTPHPVLPDEPDAATSLRAGAALVTASGDKLLGGPQAGLLLGRADLVHTLRRHPTARAFRVDKLTLAALEATLRGPASPVRQALDAGLPALRARTEALAHALATGAAIRPGATNAGPSPAGGHGMRTATQSAKATVTRPEATAPGPEAAIAGPQAATAGPEATVAGQEAAVPGPESAVAGQEAGVPGSEADVAGSQAATAGPEATVAGQEAGVPGPEAAIAGSEADVAGAEAAVAGAWSVKAEVVESVAAVGGGGAPGVELPSVAIALPEAYAVALRRGDPPVVGRVERGRCLLDLRTVDPADDGALLAAVRAAAERPA